MNHHLGPIKADHKSIFFQLFVLFFVAGLLQSLPAYAGEIKVLSSPVSIRAWTPNQIQEIVGSVIDVNSYREVRVQIFPKYLVLQLLQEAYHRVDFLRVNLDQHQQVKSIQANYAYSADEIKSLDIQMGIKDNACPDPEVQFIAFAPNDEPTEQGVTLDVIQAAQAKGYKVVSLLKEKATRANYLAYMACPKLVGNFYDGDSNPQSFITVDGVINATEISAMKGLFGFHVTNIWVACEAFNDPMLSSVTKDAQAQKYAAGINDLLVGPSDQAAACAMKAAIAGQPMTQAFQDCYRQLDSANDKWGFGGQGSDIFAH